MATATDNFNRSETLTTPWTNRNGTFTANGTSGVPGTLGSDCEAIYNGGALAGVTGNQYAQAAITVTGGVSESGIGVAVRWSATTRTGYYACVAGAVANNVALRRANNGAPGGVVFTTQTFAAGDILRVEVTGTGTSTVVLVRRAPVGDPTNFATLMTFNDTTNPIDTGFPGLAYSSTSTTASLDNWEGGDMTSGLTANVGDGLSVTDLRYTQVP